MFVGLVLILVLAIIFKACLSIEKNKMIKLIWNSCSYIVFNNINVSVSVDANTADNLLCWCLTCTCWDADDDVIQNLHISKMMIFYY